MVNFSGLCRDNVYDSNDVDETHFSVHDDVIKSNVFRVTGPLCGVNIGHRWIPLTKSSDTELWFFFIWAWINGWVNNREAGDSRRHRAHYDVTVMWLRISRCRARKLFATIANSFPELQIMDGVGKFVFMLCCSNPQFRAIFKKTHSHLLPAKR